MVSSNFFKKPDKITSLLEVSGKLNNVSGEYSTSNIDDETNIINI